MKQECINILNVGISIMDILENLCGGIFSKLDKKKEKLKKLKTK